jgi:hypothetical protein
MGTTHHRICCFKLIWRAGSSLHIIVARMMDDGHAQAVIRTAISSTAVRPSAMAHFLFMLDVGSVQWRALKKRGVARSLYQQHMIQFPTPVYQLERHGGATFESKTTDGCKIGCLHDKLY